MEERPMDESHESLLRTALKLGPEDPLPENVVDIYWDVARTSSRMGGTMSHPLLVLVVMLSGKGTPADPVSFLDEKDVSRGDRVLAKFRGKWRWGRWVLVDLADKKIHVQLDEDAGEDIRKFQPSSVRWPTRDELKSIGEA